MPYIPQERRELLDEGIYQAAEGIESPEELNYVISKIAALCLLGSDQLTPALTAISGALGEAQAEFRRRYVVPHANEQIEEHGDLFDDEPPSG